MKKQLKSLYDPPTNKVVVVDVPIFSFLMIDGSGDPNTSQEYREAIESLYAVSYTLKFMLKKSTAAVDYSVMPLEGLWWTDEMGDFSMENKSKWKWTALIMQPEFVMEAQFRSAVEQVKKKRNLAALPKMRFLPFNEGLSAQIMHIGPYAAEKPTIERLHEYIRQNSYESNGKHHEIYLGDPRRTVPEKLRTVVRQPVRKKK